MSCKTFINFLLQFTSSWSFCSKLFILTKASSCVSDQTCSLNSRLNWSRCIWKYSHVSFFLLQCIKSAQFTIRSNYEDSGMFCCAAINCCLTTQAIADSSIHGIMHANRNLEFDYGPTSAKPTSACLRRNSLGFVWCDYGEEIWSNNNSWQMTISIARAWFSRKRKLTTFSSAPHYAAAFLGWMICCCSTSRFRE